MGRIKNYPLPSISVFFEHFGEGDVCVTASAVLVMGLSRQSWAPIPLGAIRFISFFFGKVDLFTTSIKRICNKHWMKGFLGQFGKLHAYRASIAKSADPER